MRRGPSLQAAWADPHALLACLNAPAVRRLDEHDRQTLHATLVRATRTARAPGDLIVVDGCPMGRVLAHGTAVLYRPDPEEPLLHRLLEIDAGGAVTAVFNRDPRGQLREMWLTLVGGGAVGLLPGGAHHPLWGPSDRLVHAVPGRAPTTLTLAGAVAWRAIDLIPPVAEPARMPSGAGSALINALAGLAGDQGRGALRYRGPYPTEQLFWSLTESFHTAPTGSSVDPLARFLANAEEIFARGAPDEVPVDWIPAPHERRVDVDGVVAQLRDGVERIVWEGRSYHRIEGQELRRREHRIVRALQAEHGERRHAASLAVLGQVVEDHLVLDDDGQVLERRAPAPDPPGETPLAPPWREALGALLPLEATPLLAGAIEAVWPEIRLAWGPVAGDLVEARGTSLRLSPKLGRVYRATWRAAGPGMRRGVAQQFVREVLGLIGPALRNAAVTWLEALPPARQQTELEAAAGRDRGALASAALAPLGRLLDALEVGDAIGMGAAPSGTRLRTKPRRPSGARQRDRRDG